MSGNVLALVSGFVFAVGLALSGMTSPAKVRAFLDVGGAWDASLAFVMAGAVGVYFVASRFVLRLRGPLYRNRFPAPPAHDVDARLFVGAALFGVGWGASGFCPGPALAAAAAGTHAGLFFVPAMLAGMALHRLVDRGAAVTSGLSAPASSSCGEPAQSSCGEPASTDCL